MDKQNKYEHLNMFGKKDREFSTNLNELINNLVIIGNEVDKLEYEVKNFKSIEHELNNIEHNRNFKSNMNKMYGKSRSNSLLM